MNGIIFCWLLLLSSILNVQRRQDVADRNMFSLFVLFILPMKIAGLLTVDDVTDAAVIVVVLF